MGVRNGRPGESRFQLGTFAAHDNGGEIRITISQRVEMFDFPLDPAESYDVEIVTHDDGRKHLEVHPSGDE